MHDHAAEAFVTLKIQFKICSEFQQLLVMLVKLSLIIVDRLNDITCSCFKSTVLVTIVNLVCSF